MNPAWYFIQIESSHASVVLRYGLAGGSPLSAVRPSITVRKSTERCVIWVQRCE